jgi:plasmid stability protein
VCGDIMISFMRESKLMAQLVVRNLESEVKTKLQRRARRHGRSMEEELRDILRNAANEEVPAGGLGSEIAGLFRKVGWDVEIPELRGFHIKPPSFEP